MMKKLIRAIIAFIIIFAVVMICAIAFGGPGNPPPMTSINDPFKSIQFSDVPSPSHFTARDQSKLTYYTYPAAPNPSKGSIVLVHGSSANARSMHVMAKAYAASGYTAYALDIRGHGDSGERGKIAYVGQLEDDLEDFLISAKVQKPITLAGFSSGGGFALRFAGSNRQTLFANYLLLSPFISPDAPSYRPKSGGWASVGVPRWVALAIVNEVGVKLFNDLAVTRFALEDRVKVRLTPEYSYSLAANFKPQRDYQATIRAAKQPMSLLAGVDDEVFHSDKFAEIFKAEGKDIPIILIPGVGHIPLTLDTAAVQEAVTVVDRMNVASAK
jgi:alpha-beta hydrolase superfamily lysophospholipase